MSQKCKECGNAYTPAVLEWFSNKAKMWVILELVVCLVAVAYAAYRYIYSDSFLVLGLCLLAAIVLYRFFSAQLNLRCDGCLKSDSS